MLLGNKCDMEDKRVVPKAKGEQVRRTALMLRLFVAWLNKSRWSNFSSPKEVDRGSLPTPLTVYDFQENTNFSWLLFQIAKTNVLRRHQVV